MDYSGKIITKNAVEPSQTSAPGVWTLDQAAQAVESNTWPVANVPNPISRSLRFNSADSAYLNRTPASAGNSKTFTISLWFKRSKLGASTGFLDGDSSDGNKGEIYFDSSDKLNIYDFYAASGGLQITSARVFRDVGAWMHIVFVFDTPQATDSNRLKIYINGVQENLANWTVGSGASRYPSQDANFSWNGAASHWIGRNNAGSAYFDGYMTQFNSIDGQALDATYFGMTDPRTGAWISKPYTGTYGTNGFYLNFSDNSTTAALGTDYSGNSNTWTTNNFSVTTGSGNDSMVDVPTNWVAYNTGDVGGVIRGNYATLNPLASIGTYSNGNLDWVGQSSGDNTAASTIGVTSGKWYWEVQALSTSNLGTNGVIYDPSRADLTTTGGYNSPNGYAMDWASSPPLLKYGGTSTSYGTTITSTSDVVMVALDLDNQTLYFGRNGTWFNSSNPATGTSPAVSSLPTGKTWFATVGDQWGAASSQWTTNFGQRPFAYTPPAGFKSLCTTNLPEPTVLDGGDYFNAVLWNGATSGTSINVTGFGFQPDLIWTKARNNSYDHYLQDAVRGIGVGNQNTLSSNTTGSEADTSGLATSFLSDGFNISSSAGSTSAGNTEVTWAWKESATSGFDIVTYTGDGVAGRTVSHNLGVAPAMIIVKSRGTTDSWGVYHASLGNTKGLYLETTSAAVTSSAFWNDTSPTSTVFSVSNNSINNANAVAYVAYLFAAVPGFSAFGSYAGSGDSNGPFVFTGFRPRFVLIKGMNQVGYWMILDTARNTYNVVDNFLRPNTTDGDLTGYPIIDILSNGFKPRSVYGVQNDAGYTYIYAAFAENPFKYSNAR